MACREPRELCRHSHPLASAQSLLTNTFSECNGTWGPPLAGGPPLSDNWFDDVRFGWHDALVGLYAVQSFQKLGDLQAWLGDHAGANVSYAICESAAVSLRRRIA